MRNRFAWALVVALAQAGCDGSNGRNGSDLATPTGPVVLPSVSSFTLNVFLTSGGRCLADAQLQIVAPQGVVSPPGLQTAEFCHQYETGVPYWDPIAFAGGISDNEWPITVAASSPGYVSKRVEVTREQEQRHELLVIDLVRE